MIGQLVRTEIKANRALLSISTGIAFVLFFLAVDASGLSIGAGTTVSIVVSILVPGLFLVRGKQEKRIRALSQLPTTPLQVGIAGWCFTLLSLCVPCLIWLLFASLPGSQWGLMTDTDSGRVVLGALPRSIAEFYFGAVSVVASVSISVTVMSRPPSRARFLKWLWALAVAVGVFTFANSLGARDLLLSAPVLIPLGSGLVIADIWLHNRADNYLG